MVAATASAATMSAFVTEFKFGILPRNPTLTPRDSSPEFPRDHAPVWVRFA